MILTRDTHNDNSKYTKKFNMATFGTMIKVRDFSSVPGEQNSFFHLLHSFVCEIAHLFI